VEGWTTDQRTIKKPLALHVFWPAMELDTTARARGRGRGAGAPETKSLEDQAKERRAKVRAAEDFFEEAKAYARAKDAAAKGNAPVPERVPAWGDAAAHQGRVALTIHATKCAKSNPLCNGRYESFPSHSGRGPRRLDGRRFAGVEQSPVVYGQTFVSPARDFESYDVHFKAPELLRQAGEGRLQPLDQL
jgi:hypothetical protein